LPSAFFDELTAETRGDDGKWRKSSNSVRNEATDHYVYGWAVVLEKAANKIDWERPPRWAAPHDINSEIITASDLAARGTAQAAPRRRRRR
jgi:phage terminase large subunit GpA-like protein